MIADGSPSLSLNMIGISNMLTLTAIESMVASNRIWDQVSKGNKKKKPITRLQFAIGPPRLIFRNWLLVLPSSLKLKKKKEKVFSKSGAFDLESRAPKKCPHSCRIEAMIVPATNALIRATPCARIRSVSSAQ